MRISDWSSDVCSSDLAGEDQHPAVDPSDQPSGHHHRKHGADAAGGQHVAGGQHRKAHQVLQEGWQQGEGGEQHDADHEDQQEPDPRSEEHTSELQSLMRISYAVFCLKNKNTTTSYT